jgi:tetratricopeptide (TPR) repeat protein
MSRTLNLAASPALLLVAALLGPAATAAVQSDSSPSILQVDKKGDAALTLATPKDSPSNQLTQAENLIKQHRPGDALSILDAVIAAEESSHRDDKRVIYSARSPEESLFYLMQAAVQKKSAVALNETWSTAYFLKGYALIDLNRAEEAKPYFDKAIALSPMNAQFLAERGEWFKNRKAWTNAFADFESAATASDFSPEDVKSFEKRRALRGMAFIHTERGQLKEAEKLLNQCLKIDPSDASAKRELDYIHSLK